MPPFVSEATKDGFDLTAGVSRPPDNNLTLVGNVYRNNTEWMASVSCDIKWRKMYSKFDYQRNDLKVGPRVDVVAIYTIRTSNSPVIDIYLFIEKQTIKYCHNLVSFIILNYD